MTALSRVADPSIQPGVMPASWGVRPFCTSTQTFFKQRSNTTVSEWLLEGIAGPAVKRVIGVSPAFRDAGSSMRSKIGQLVPWASDTEQVSQLRERVDQIYWTTLGSATADDDSRVVADAVQYLRQLKALENNIPHRKAGKWLMGMIESALGADDLKLVDMILRYADPDGMSSWSVNAMLRSTYRARHFLPAWSSALKRAQIKLAEREDAKGLFVGLE